jgi:hypothetical protein
MDTKRRWTLDITVWVIGLLASMVLIAHEAMASGKLATPPNDQWKDRMRQLPYRLSASASAGTGLASHDVAARQAFRNGREPRSGRRSGDWGVSRALFRLESARTARPGGLRITETAWFIHEHGEFRPQPGSMRQ